MSQPLAVYIHWPYCARICPYCDFNVYKNRADVGLIPAIIADLEGWKKETGPRKISSIHFGGGTPSLLGGAQSRRVIDVISGLWDTDADCEIAMEANPSDAKPSHWESYKEAGINRLSLGVQTFHDKGLKLLGRDHDGEAAQAALAMATDIFDNVSLDLIFGWQGQSIDNLKTDIDIALARSPAHISAYQLTIEQETAFGRAFSRGDDKSVSESLSADMYEWVAETLKSQGFEHYEVSNFARDGFRSRHNMAYWRGQDYLGVGPGAHGRITKEGKRYATLAWAEPENYANNVAHTGIGLNHRDLLTPQNWGDEYVLMGLRISDGISLARYKAITGKTLSNQTISALSDNGYLIRKGDSLLATEEGRLLLNKVTEELLTN